MTISIAVVLNVLMGLSFMLGAAAGAVPQKSEEEWKFAVFFYKIFAVIGVVNLAYQSPLWAPAVWHGITYIGSAAQHAMCNFKVVPYY